MGWSRRTLGIEEPTRAPVVRVSVRAVQGAHHGIRDRIGCELTHRPATSAAR